MLTFHLSQNPRMVWDRRDLKPIQFQPSCHVQGHLPPDQADQSPISLALYTSRDEASKTSLGKFETVPGLLCLLMTNMLTLKSKRIQLSHTLSNQTMNSNFLKPFQRESWNYCSRGNFTSYIWSLSNTSSKMSGLLILCLRAIVLFLEEILRPRYISYNVDGICKTSCPWFLVFSMVIYALTSLKCPVEVLLSSWQFSWVMPGDCGPK